MTEISKAKVYFDGSCPICRAEISYYQSRTGEGVDYVDVSHVDNLTSGDPDYETAMRRFHVRTAEGQLTSGARAFGELWRYVPGFKWLHLFLKIPGAVLFAEGCYRVFLLIRPYLQRATSPQRK